jgi:hypothetical protein
MAHSYDHAITSAKKWGGIVEDYLPIESWFDETKAWIGNMTHRAFRHHAEGIFECEKIFGIFIINSDGKKVYVRQIGEKHVKEDCFGVIPTAKDWLVALSSEKKPEWFYRTQKIKTD